ncbi:MAG: FCSD flavin-binding domain-containing protein [Thiotrichaceae bacterium]
MLPVGHPVDRKTFESKQHKDIYVIGDAGDASKMPKSAYSANTYASKVCATAVVAALQGKEMTDPAYVNTCYSIVGKDFGISVAAVYRLGEDGVITPVEGSAVSVPKDATPEHKHRSCLCSRIGSTISLKICSANCLLLQCV